MKKSPSLHILVALVVLIISTTECLAHWEWVHQYMAMQGYNLLKNHRTLTSQYDSFFQLNQYGAPVHETICLTPDGGWVEDHRDIVFGYCGFQPIPFFDDCPEVTASHFWNPDEPNVYHQTNLAAPSGSYENAYKKAEILWNGQVTIFIPGPWNFANYQQEGAVLVAEGLSRYENWAAIYIRYESLPLMFRNRTYTFLGVRTVYGTQVMFQNPHTVTLSDGYLDVFFSANILGRIAHLLGDMNVPSHVRALSHPCDVIGKGSQYEMHMSNSLYDGLGCTAARSIFPAQQHIASGDLIYVPSLHNPLKYLFYTTAQIADCYTEYRGTDLSDSYVGDREYNTVDPITGDNYQEMQQIIQTIPSSFQSVSEQYANQGSVSFVYTLRALAGLFFWFGLESGSIVDANTIYVPGDYSTLSAALAVATSGKTVVVNGIQTIGSYLSVPSGVSLRLNAGSTLQFSSSATRLLIYGNLFLNGSPSSHVTIDGQGYSRSGYIYPLILVASGGTASIEYADFKNAPYLFTAYNSAGSVSVQNCSFTNYGTSTDAKAITVTSASGAVTIASNSITGSNQGIGIYSYSNGTNVSITGNTITYCGTGIRPYSSNASIRNNTIHNNVNYGILADNAWYQAEYAGNDIRSNGYGLYLNSSSPLIYQNIIIENGSNVSMTSSMPEFAEPGSGPGHNVIAYAGAPLLRAQNSSLPCLGYYSNAGYNSIYGTDLPHMYALNNTIIYADRNYWDEPPGSCYTDGTSTFLSRDPLSNDPNPNPLGKIAVAEAGTSSSSENISGKEDDDLTKEMILRAISAAHNGELSQAKDTLTWILNNNQTSAYAPLALMAYGNLSGLKGNMLDADKTVKIESDFQTRLEALKESSKDNPLRPHAIRFLARSATIVHDLKSAARYSEQLVIEYPGTVHEMVSQYDLLVTAIEVDQDYAKAQKILEVLKKKFPDSDLTVSARMLCGEKVLPGSPKEEVLKQNAVTENEMSAAFPNPFNPSTSIAFSLKSDSRVRLTVYDVLGREVVKLSDGVRSAGQHSVVWNAQSVTSGVYFARLEVADLYGKILFSKTAKLVMTK
jgi:hypothetical protein